MTYNTEEPKVYFIKDETENPYASKSVEPLRFSASGTQAVGIKSIDYDEWNYEDMQAPTANLEYSLDNGSNWTTWTDGEPVTFGNGTDLLVRGMNPDGFTKLNGGEDYGFTGRFNRVLFKYDEPVTLSGSIMSLINYEEEVTAIPNEYAGCFTEMFAFDDEETSLGLYDALYDISELKLPATTLAERCYYDMFYGCTSLTTAPAELPATTLAQDCYYNMFAECSSLTQAPELPATTLTNACYQYMFDSCTSLTQAPELPATTLAQDCYYNMFNNCTSLTQAPELPATTLASYCYRSMFKGCTSLTSIPIYATDISAGGCLLDFVKGGPSTGTLYCEENMVDAIKDAANGSLDGWTWGGPRRNVK